MTQQLADRDIDCPSCKHGLFEHDDKGCFALVTNNKKQVAACPCKRNQAEVRGSYFPTWNYKNRK